MDIESSKCSFLSVVPKHVQEFITDAFWAHDLGFRAYFFHAFSRATVYGIKNFLRIQLALLLRRQGGRKNVPTDTGSVRKSDQQEIQEVVRPQVLVEMFIHELVIAQMLAEAAELALV